MNEKFDEILKIIAGNESLKNAILEAQRKAESEGLSVDSYAKQLFDILKEHGIDVSCEEIVNMINESREVEIANEELKNVAGGCGGDDCPKNWPCDCVCNGCKTDCGCLNKLVW